MSRLVDINWTPTDRVLRDFGGIAAGVFGLVAVSMWRHWLWFAHRDVPPALMWSVAALAVFSLVAAFVAPRANRPLFIGLTLVSFPIGFVMSHVIMAALFFVVLTPVAAVMRIIGRDPLHRRVGPSAASYWSPVERARAKSQYFRQF